MQPEEIIAAFAQRLEAGADHAEASKHSVANLGILPVEDCRLIAAALRRPTPAPLTAAEIANGALGIDWRDTESQARRVAEHAETLFAGSAEGKSVSGNGQHVAPVPEPFENAETPGRLTSPIAVAHLAKMISDQEPGGPAVAGEVQYLPVHPLTFTYRNYRGEVSTRRVLPIKIHFGPTQWHPIPQYLLRALDLDKEAVRDFAWADISPAAEAP